MSYVKNNLLPNEQVLYQSKVHWIVLVSPSFWILCTVIASYMKIPWQFVLVPLIMSVFYIIHSFVFYRFSEYAVTNKRVLIKVGFISRQSLDTFLQKIEGIQVIQNIPGRIFNYGTIAVIGTGGTYSYFSMIDDPLTFRINVQAQIEKRLTS